MTDGPEATAPPAQKPAELPGGPVGASVRAYIDLGTNSVRLLLARFHEERAYTVLSDQKEPVRLGEDEFTDGLLRPAAMDRAILVCRRFAEMARTQGADVITTVATSATREAINRDAFVRALERETGLRVRVISGLEEARLIYRGVASGLHLGERSALFVDIGGGSTEVAIGDQSSYVLLDSLKLGAVRLATLFTAPLDPEPISPQHYAFMRRYVTGAAVRSIQRIHPYRYEFAVGSSGTIETLAEMASRMHSGRPRERNEPLTRSDLAEVARELCRNDLEARRKLPGLNPVRADIIVAGAALVESLMDALGLAEITVSERGLREGLIEDDLAVRNPDALAGLSIRERSVLDLVERCRADPVHARTVRRLTHRLFDEGARIGLHSLGPVERELAGLAALLHDVGTFLSYSDHHLHSYYVIRNTDLLGFDESEIAVMAAVARFHRKSTPRRRYPEYSALDKRSRRTVRVLAAFVRLAESLDRSHGTLVDDVELAPGPDRTIVLRLLSQRSCDLEQWGAEAQGVAFRRTFGRDLRIEGAGDSDSSLQSTFVDAPLEYAPTYQDSTS